jgi:deoxyribose-phosphate aldolase
MPEQHFTDPAASARVALACLDLTRLNDGDTEADIEQLCERAQGRYGPVAAVCVWPHLAAIARRHLPATIAVAAVANFPDGSTDLARVAREIGQIRDAGAQEVDVVLPYATLRAGDEAAAVAVLHEARRSSRGLRLKVILETGELATPALIARASTLALDAGADFIKTSTGKTPTGCHAGGRQGDARPDRRPPPGQPLSGVQGIRWRANRGRRGGLPAPGSRCAGRRGLHGHPLPHRCQRPAGRHRGGAGGAGQCGRWNRVLTARSNAQAHPEPAGDSLGDEVCLGGGGMIHVFVCLECPGTKSVCQTQ